MEIKKKLQMKDILIIQAIVVIYTLCGVAGKYASGYELYSFGFVTCYVAEIFLLGIYAILWQQIIKKYDLSIAYANRSIALMWSMLWAVILFHETISAKNLLGATIVIVGTMIVNGEKNG